MKKLSFAILGLLWVVGVSAQKTPEIEAMESAYQDGQLCLFYKIGKAYAEQEDYVSAVEWYKKAFVKYSSDQLFLAEDEYDCVLSEYQGAAYLRLADCYYEGHGVEADCKKAFKYYQLCLKSRWEGCDCVGDGIIDRMYARLGSLYRDGAGTRRNLKKAYDCYVEGLAVTDYAGVQCMYELALCYLNGWGTDRDVDSGIEWLYQCAKQGNSDAAELIQTLQQTHPEFFE